MVIRHAVPEDVPQIMSLAAKSETAAHWSRRGYDALFAADAPQRVALVSVEGLPPGAVAGFVIARFGGDAWEIENVVVDPRLRQEGIGRRLIERVMREARENGATAILLEVRESNAGARALYAAAGFREEGRRRAYYRDPEEDALLLRMAL